MTIELAAPPFMVRPYEQRDEEPVLALLDAALGGGPAGLRPPEFFRWKHFANPFGPSFMLVAESESGIIGLRAFMRWRFVAESRTLRAVRAVDTATHPDFQGRGVFSRLTMAALADLRGQIDFVFNTPNEKSLPGYLKMGWTRAGSIPVRMNLLRPLRFLANVRTLRTEVAPPEREPGVAAPTAADALLDTVAFADLLSEAESDRTRLHTPKDLAYLQWRYGAATLLGYRGLTEERGGRIVGAAFFRVRPRGRLWEITLADVIVRPGDGATARRLLRRVARAASADHITCSAPRPSTVARSLPRTGFVPVPGGIPFVVNPLADLPVDPTDLGNWSLSLGDVEVF